MSEYIVSARKYRPGDFSSVVGQESITRTLKNAIKSNQLAQAYLFCGPRGVGKTTCARILAKTINCRNLTPGYEACNECESCRTFNQSRAFNIHELDAASNNSVDDIRNLIDQVRVPPQVGKYSVYIIDEVHMLSAQAFNAFLKTLEEPPAHALFIMATTEKHKILPTILSRCQIYDFKRIKAEDTVAYLKAIAGKEGIQYETEALNIIALKAEGAMRDALSIFDQLVNFSEKNISYQMVIDNLNVLDFEYYFKLVDAFLEGDVSAAFLIFDELLEKGFDPQHFVNGLSSHFRDLLVCKEPDTLKLLEVGEGIKEKYLEQTKKCPPTTIYKALSITNQCDLHYKNSNNKRLHVELALVSLCNLGENIKKKRDDKQPVAGARGETEAVGAEKSASGSGNAGETSASGSGNASEKKPAEGTHAGDIPENQSARDTKGTSAQETNEGVAEGAHGTGKPEATSPAGGKGAMAGNENADGGASLQKKSFSIKDALNNGPATPDPAEAGQTGQAAGEEKRKAFSQDDLNRQWQAMAAQYQGSEPRFSSILKAIKPELKDNYLIACHVENSLQAEAVRQKQNELLGLLRGSLENEQISIETSIKTENDSYKPYTSEDKYLHLKQKNENLELLKQKFNLDFE